jgi:Fe-S cluster assembly iron-binding protein IscA
MLEMTEGAAVMIRRMRSRAEALGGVDGHVLRVAPSVGRDEAGVRIAFVTVPHDGDQVGESHGIPWCIDGSVAELLDEMVLDCHPDDSTGLFIRARSVAAAEGRSPQR